VTGFFTAGFFTTAFATFFVATAGFDAAFATGILRVVVDFFVAGIVTHPVIG
jgi:hypothetical protein